MFSPAHGHCVRPAGTELCSSFFGSATAASSMRCARRRTAASFASAGSPRAQAQSFPGDMHVHRRRARPGRGGLPLLRTGGPAGAVCQPLRLRPLFPQRPWGAARRGRGCSPVAPGRRAGPRGCGGRARGRQCGERGNPTAHCCEAVFKTTSRTSSEWQHPGLTSAGHTPSGSSRKAGSRPRRLRASR